MLKPTHLLAALLLYAILLTPSAVTAQSKYADGPLLDQLLIRMTANFKSNNKLAMQYINTETVVTKNFDKHGKQTEDKTEKYENIFLDQLPYRRLYELNGKPLVGKEAEKEKERYDKAIAERKAMTTDQKKSLLSKHWSFSLPICCLATLFNNHILREDTLDGRRVLVVESTPKPDALSTDKTDKSSLDWKETAWIDEEDELPSRLIWQKLNDTDHMLKGYTIEVEYTRLLDSPATYQQPSRSVWLAKQEVTKGTFKLMFVIVGLEQTNSWSDFKRFHVDIELLGGTVEATETPAK